MNRVYKLKKRSDFLEVSKIGNSVAAKGVVVVAMKRADSAKGSAFIANNKNIIKEDVAKEDIVRVGYTVTKKIGNAVVRNKIKRRFRVLAKSLMPKLAEGGYDYVFIARYHTVNRTFISLEKDISYALHTLRKRP